MKLRKVNSISSALDSKMVCTISGVNNNSLFSEGQEIIRIKDYETQIGSVVIRRLGDSFKAELISNYTDNDTEKISLYGIINSLLKLREYLSERPDINSISIPNIDNELVDYIIDILFRDTNISIKYYKYLIS